MINKSVPFFVNLASLSITAPAGFSGSFALTVAATSLETSTGEIANLAVTLPVTVVPTNVTSPLVIDLNGDDQTDAGGGRSLADRGIESINVNHTIAPEVQDGNWLLERGTFSDGHAAEMAAGE